MSMQCSRCQQSIPDHAAFCMHCGNPREQPGAASSAPAPTTIAQRTSTSRLPWVLGGLLVALLIGGFFLLKASGYLQAKTSQSPGELLQAQGSRSSDILSARGSQNNVPLDATTSRRVMPADIRAWLEHLERTETKRADLAGEQLSAAIVTMTELQLGGGLDAIKAMIDDTGEGDLAKSPAETTKADLEKYTDQWRILEDEFHSVPPPAECVPIRDAYRTALSETGAMITEIVGQFQGAQAEPAKAINALNKMKGTSDSRIGTPSRNTDRLVGDVCHKYDTAKWFSINADFGGGMFGKLGL